MQGVVSKTGGTEAGVFPKYKNDIDIITKLRLRHPTRHIEKSSLMLIL